MKNRGGYIDPPGCNRVKDFLSKGGRSVETHKLCIIMLINPSLQNFSEKLFFAGISVNRNVTFKTNLYLLWSLPLNTSSILKLAHCEHSFNSTTNLFNTIWGYEWLRIG